MKCQCGFYLISLITIFFILNVHACIQCVLLISTSYSSSPQDKDPPPHVPPKVTYLLTWTHQVSVELQLSTRKRAACHGPHSGIKLTLLFSVAHRFQLWVGALNPLLLHDDMLTSLSRSYAGNHNDCELTCEMVTPLPEHSSWQHPASLTSFPSPFHNLPWYSGGKSSCYRCPVYKWALSVAFS